MEKVWTPRRDRGAYRALVQGAPRHAIRLREYGSLGECWAILDLLLMAGW